MLNISLKHLLIVSTGSLILLFIAPIAKSQETLLVTSETDSASVVEDSSTHQVDYQLTDSLGGRNFVEVDLQSGDYWVTTEDYDIFTGSIPQAAQDEYHTEGIPIPCFAGPWAAAGCVGAAAVTAFYCEMRANTNIRRGQRQCERTGQSFHVTDISNCGNVSGHCFGPRTYQQEQ